MSNKEHKADTVRMALEKVKTATLAPSVPTEREKALELEVERLRGFAVEIGNYLVDYNRKNPKDLYMRHGRSLAEQIDTWRPMHRLVTPAPAAKKE
jgi:hypothetical protein